MIDESHSVRSYLLKCFDPAIDLGKNNRSLQAHANVHPMHIPHAHHHGCVTGMFQVAVKANQFDIDMLRGTIQPAWFHQWTYHRIIVSSYYLRRSRFELPKLNSVRDDVTVVRRGFVSRLTKRSVRDFSRKAHDPLIIDVIHPSYYYYCASPPSLLPPPPFSLLQLRPSSLDIPSLPYAVHHPYDNGEAQP